MARILRVVMALVPLGAAPAVLWLLADGPFNFGGGEKDVVLIFPWMLWSLLFAVAFLVETRKPISLGKGLLRAVGWSAGCMIVLWLVLYVAASTWLGM